MERRSRSRSLIFPAELRGAARVAFCWMRLPEHTTQQNDEWFSFRSCRITVAHDQRNSAERQRHHSGASISGRRADDKVPANAPVTEVAPQKVTLGAGDTVYAVRMPHGDIVICGIRGRFA